jgi:AraC-like DNA-binding protein
MLDVESASEAILGICSLLHIVPIDIRVIKKRLLAERAYHLVRGTETIAHIFTEFYSAPPALKESYIRLKLIELLMFLSSAEPRDQERRHYFYKTRVDIVKAIRDHLTANLDKRFTLPELSQLFDIPLTAMKNCFRTVYGSPIGEYMREYRLQAAAVLLCETEEPISEIATRVGYDSHTKFTAAFRAYAGVVPSEYRKVFVRKE